MCVKALLANGAHINATDNASWTALMFAASEDSTHVLEALIKGGKSITIKESRYFVYTIHS